MTRLTTAELGTMQRDQHRHDMRNHFDILSLHKTERLKHYGLHYCKYAGRIARGVDEEKSYERTLVDTFLVMLSAANTMHQHLSEVEFVDRNQHDQIDPLRPFVDAAGRFADACEKIDHLEDFAGIAKLANADIAEWLIDEFEAKNVDPLTALNERRAELAARQFFIG